MSPRRARLKRAPLERTGPIRGPRMPNFTGSDGTVLGAVECGVRTAYAVIDDYMRRGREAASRYAQGCDGRSDMSDNRYNYGHPYAAWGPMWPFVAPWVQAMQAWACAMTAFAPPGGPRPWDPYATYGAPTCATTPRVSVTVASRSRAQVSVCVDPGADAVALTADPLTAADDPKKPPLRAVEIKTDCGHVRVSVTIPYDQPPGRYVGAIRDASGCRRGELAVDLFEDAKSHAAVSV